VATLTERERNVAKKSHEKVRLDREIAGQNESATAPKYPFSYLHNIANSASSNFYQQRGIRDGVSAFEIHTPDDPLIMQCRYCLRHALGYCVKNGGKRPVWKEPLSLQLADGRMFRLEFDCQHCQMNIYGMTKTRSVSDLNKNNMKIKK
ncbi:MAG: hypothetical protein J6O49_11785, partial [Bacteroidaceae bacterium]|nr:hypothetical protein [Bacteroidaceae bacterium]